MKGRASRAATVLEPQNKASTVIMLHRHEFIASHCNSVLGGDDGARTRRLVSKSDETFRFQSYA